MFTCAIICTKCYAQYWGFNASSHIAPSFGARNLQQEDEKKLSYHEKKAQMKATKLTNLIQKIEKVPSPKNFRPDEGYGTHNPSSPHVVFAAAMSTTLMRRDANMFCKTLRKTGYTGDIVVAISAGSMQPFLDALKQNNAVVYTVVTECTGKGSEVCNFPGQEEQFSINMIRFYLYTWWAQQYGKNRLMLFSLLPLIFLPNETNKCIILHTRHTKFRTVSLCFQTFAMYFSNLIRLHISLISGVPLIFSWQSFRKLILIR